MSINPLAAQIQSAARIPADAAEFLADYAISGDYSGGQLFVGVGEYGYETWLYAVIYSVNGRWFIISGYRLPDGRFHLVDAARGKSAQALRSIFCFERNCDYFTEFTPDYTPDAAPVLDIPPYDDMTAPPCPLCGESLHEIVYPVIVPGKPVIVHVTCFNADCPIEGRTLSPVDLAQLAEQTRQAIVLHWTFEQCLARPCPVTLNTALTLMAAEAHRHDNLERVRLQYHEFAAVCRDDLLLQQAARLLCSYAGGAA